MEELTIRLKPDIKEALEKIANDNFMSLRRLCELILEMFPEDGKIYNGVWHAGGKGAKRLLVDWPKFTSPVVTLKKEELD